MVLVGFPTVLFVAALMVWHLFRGPYLIYQEEYGKASSTLEAAERAKTVAESYASTAKGEIDGIPKLKQQTDELRRRTGSSPSARRPGAIWGAMKRSPRSYVNKGMSSVRSRTC